MKIQTFLFDLDGTLINSKNLIIKSISYALEQLDLPKITELQISDTIGLPIKDQVQKIFLGTVDPFSPKILDKIIEKNLEYQIKHWKDLMTVCEGVIPMLNLLKDKGKKLGLVTSRGMTTTMLFLKDLGLMNYFDCCIASEQTKKHKPDPDPVLFALHYLQELPKMSIYIGDSPYDIICGEQAGTITGKAMWCEHTNKTETHPIPNYIFNSCDEIKNLLE